MKIYVECFKQTGKFYASGEITLHLDDNHPLWVVSERLKASHASDSGPLTEIVFMPSIFHIRWTAPGHEYEHPFLIPAWRRS